MATNRLELTGIVANDVKASTLKDGRKIANFKLRFGGKMSGNNVINVVAVADDAVACEKYKKGDTISLVGEIATRYHKVNGATVTKNGKESKLGVTIVEVRVVSVNE